MNIVRTLTVAVIALMAIFAFTSLRVDAKVNQPVAILFPRGVSQDPAEQDKRLEHLPGTLPEAVKTLRGDDYRTHVSNWSEKDRGGGLSEGQLSLDGDAGYPYSDGGFSDCNHIDYYTLNYKRVVKDTRQTLNAVDPNDAERGLNAFFIPLEKALRPLVSNGGYVVTHVRTPGRFNTEAELTLVKVTEVADDKPKYVVEKLELRQSVYDHCSMRRD